MQPAEHFSVSRYPQVAPRTPAVVVRCGQLDEPLVDLPSSPRGRLLTLPGLGDEDGLDHAALLDDEFSAVDDLLALSEEHVEAYLVTPVTPFPLTQRIPTAVAPMRAPVLGASDHVVRAIGLVAEALRSWLGTSPAPAR